VNKFEIELNLERIAEARKKWGKATASFNADVDAVMTRLLHEAATQMMSAEQVARYSGLTTKRVRTLFRNIGLDPKNGKRLMAKAAADALAENAALMGIEPREMDLMSPLMYLPMGSELKRMLEEQAEAEQPGVSGNTVSVGQIEQKAKDFAHERFSNHGPEDARGAALWDFSEWLRETYGGDA